MTTAKYSPNVLTTRYGVTIGLHAIKVSSCAGTVVIHMGHEVGGLEAGFHMTIEEAMFLAAQLVQHANTADKIDPLAASLPTADDRGKETR